MKIHSKYRYFGEYLASHKIQYKSEYYSSLEKAKVEAIVTFNEIIKDMFPDATHDGLFMTKDMKCECCGENVSSVKYSNGGKLLFGRMDGVFDGGEFFIDIVEG